MTWHEGRVATKLTATGVHLMCLRQVAPSLGRKKDQDPGRVDGISLASFAVNLDRANGAP
jgi:hypothetical protein